MGTKMLRPRKNGCNLAKLPDQQLVFVNELAADLNFNGTEAARKAGYKQPSVAACRLIGLPKIQAALGKVLRERIERCELKANAVLNYLQMALFINPLRYFTLSHSGWWIVKDIENLPDEVAQLIEKGRLNEEGECEVLLVSHTEALRLAMKHIFGEKREITLKGIDWEPLYGKSDGEEDEIEQKVLDV